MRENAWQHKRILVVGIGRSGFDAARVLHSLGAEVTACDVKAPSLASELAGIGVPVLTNWSGGLPDTHYQLVVTSPGVPRDVPLLQQAVERNIPVWSEVELAYHLTDAPIVAVTGTNGKSTTVALIAHILLTAGYQATLCGNIAAEGYERTLTDAATNAHPNQILVAEVSSFQLEWVHRFRPRVGVWTTLSMDHLNRHRSMEEYGQTKARLFTNQTIHDWSVLPADDPLVLGFVRTQARCIYFSHQKINIKDSEIVWCNDEGVYRARGTQEQSLASVKRYRLAGDHNRRNLAAAVAACLYWEVSAEQLEEAISSFEPLPHRMERVAEVDGVTYINNSMCTNLQALQESIRTAPEQVLLIMGGVDKSNSPFWQLVPLFKSKVRHVLLIGADSPRIEEQLRSAGWAQLTQCDSLEEAFAKARALVQRGDWVMLSPGCASFDMFTDFKERGRLFRELVHQLEKDGARDKTA